MDQVSDTAARLIERAQSGDERAVLAETEQLLRAATGDLADGPADLHFARAVALYVLGDPRPSMAAADLMLAAADREASAGWRSTALSFRAGERLRLGEQHPTELDLDAVLRDLVDAESAAAGSVGDPALAARAHTGVALGYHQMRLYELAVPHYEAAVRLCAEAGSGSGSGEPCMWLLNLLHLHLDWALELYRVGQSDAAEQHSRTAEALAASAAQAASGTQDERWSDMAHLMGACARADGTDPEGALADIRTYSARVAAYGMEVEFSGVAPFHAVALARSGHHAEALELIDGAVTSLSATAPWTAVAAATHTRALLLANAGSTDAQAALEYGDALAQAMWHQRLRTLHVATTMQSYENLRAEHERVAHSALTDPLTGIANRRAFDAAVLALQDSADLRRSVAVLVIDLDGFKQVNDTLGHDAGDELLRSVSAALAGNLRDGDLVARLGGDEFAALLPGARVDSAQSIAERMVEAVASIASGTATVSIGIASGQARSVRDWVLEADQAMYAAKRGGGNRVSRAAA